MSFLFNTFFYQPLYNGLIFLLSLLPSGDVGLSIILFTIFIKVLLFPLSKKALRTQQVMKEIEPRLAVLKEKIKDRQEQAKAMMEVYKEANISPFSGFLVLLIQFPIIIALYFVFYKGGLPAVNLDQLYSFVKAPASVSMHFLGLFDVSERSLSLALLTGVLQFVRAWLAPIAISGDAKEGTFKADFAKSMNLQMKYVFPLLIGFVAYSVSAAVALYLVTSTLFDIVQELFLRRTKKTI